jgi:DNA-binding XRE family transcriptional regulator
MSKRKNRSPVNRQSINRLEKDNVNPSTFYLYQIAKALDVALAELFDSKELK